MTKHIFKRTLSLALALSMVIAMSVMLTFPAAAETSVWDGTTADTSWYNDTDTAFTINTAEALAGLAAIVNGTASGIAADTFSGKTITLGESIALNVGSFSETGVWSEEGTPNTWTPIGNSASVSFSGVFNGNNKTINGLYITTNNQFYYGLFGNSIDASFSDVSFTNGYISASVTATADNTNAYAGFMSAYISASSKKTIENINIMSGNIKLTSPGTKYVVNTNAGGVAGRASGSVEISNCYNNSTVYAANGSGSSTLGNCYLAYSGGICGYLTGTSATVRATISDCRNEGMISGSGNHKSKDTYFGGISGYVDNITAQNCINMTDALITKTNDKVTKVGGIFGYCGTANISECKNYGTVNGKQAGGIIGYFNSAVASTISNCSNYGIIVSDSVAGGIVGYAYAFKNISTLYKNTNFGTVSSSLYAGGICGQASATDYNVGYSQYIKIHNAVNYGNVIGTASNTESCVGGIIGRTECATNVLASTNYGTINGTYAAGGICGITWYKSKNAQQVFNCSNLGSVNASGAVISNARSAFAGGIAGYAYSGFIQNCLSSGDVTVTAYQGDEASLTSNEQVVGGIIGSLVYYASSYTTKTSVKDGVTTYSYNYTLSDGAEINNCLCAAALSIPEAHSEAEIIGNVNDTGFRYFRYNTYTSTDVTNNPDITYPTSGYSNQTTTNINNTYYMNGQSYINYTPTDEANLAVTYSGNSAYTSDELTDETKVLAGLNTNRGTNEQWYPSVDLIPIPFSCYIQETTVAAASLTLTDSLAINVFVRNAGAAANETFNVSYSKNGEAEQMITAGASDYKIDGNNYYRYTVTGINAADMDDGYTFIVRVGDTVTDVFEYSVLKYATNMYQKLDTPDDMKALIVGMMYYGDAAQTAKGEVASLMDAFEAATGYTASETYVADGYTSLGLTKAATVTAGVLSQAALTTDGNVQVVFTVSDASATEAVVSFLGKTHTYTISDDGQFVTDCLYATSLESKFTVTIGTNSTEYSVSNYIVNGLSGEILTAEQKTLAQAMAVYMNAVSVYANK